ncbi:hypothetical protein NTE24_000769 [Vibrio mimicus]
MFDDFLDDNLFFLCIFITFVVLFFGYVWFFHGGWEIDASMYSKVDSLFDNSLARPFIVSAMEDGVITIDEYRQITDSVSSRSVLASKLEVK